MNIKYIGFFTFLLMMLLSMEAGGFEELNDVKLNAVTAGNATVDLGNAEVLARIPIQYSHKKGSVDGEVIVVPVTSHYETSNFQISDNAQSHLRSLININAVNSPIQVLLNLNVNVNSNIEQIRQLNTLLSD